MLKEIAISLEYIPLLFFPLSPDTDSVFEKPGKSTQPLQQMLKTVIVLMACGLYLFCIVHLYSIQPVLFLH